MRLYSFLRIESVCKVVFWLRFFFYAKILGRLKVHTEESSVIAHDYSVKMLLKGTTSNRPLRLIRPLSVIDKAKKDGDILSIGSRFETELLFLAAYGFKPGKIRGLDMISYSPWIDVGNMHSLPYPDNSKDVIILGWVLAYSATPEKAAGEAIRVIRNGGVIAVALSYYPQSQLLQMEKEGKLIGSRESRRQTVAALLDLFKNHVDEVFFSHDAPDKNSDGVCATIFSIKKS